MPSTPGCKGVDGAGQEQKEIVPQKLKERTTRAKRRALQEAQRALKAESQNGAVGNGASAQQPKSQTEGQGAASAPNDAKAASKSTISKETPQRKSSIGSEKSVQINASKTQDKKKKKDIPPPRKQFDDEQEVANAKKLTLVEPTETKHRVELFIHLPQVVHGTTLPSLEMKYFSEDSSHPHPAVYKAGSQFLTGESVGRECTVYCYAHGLQRHDQGQHLCSRKFL